MYKLKVFNFDYGNTNIEHPDLQAALNNGYEPFAVSTTSYGDERLWLRKLIWEKSNDAKVSMQPVTDGISNTKPLPKPKKINSC